MKLNNTAKISIIVSSIMLIISIILIVCLTQTNSVKLQSSSSFYVIPLGVNGGSEENNLSSYIVTYVNDDHTPNSTYISLDSGTIHYGITKAIEQDSLPSDTDSAMFFKDQIKAYLISHGHLDHISGFLLNTPNDKSGKSIFGLNETINIIRQNYFNDQAWPNFGPTGLKWYDYQILNPLSNESVPIANTNFNVRIFRLCHQCPYLSSAFLVSRRDSSSSSSILYLGDTGPDALEKLIQTNNQTYFPNYLDQLWKSISPLIANNQLKAIFIEVSFPNDRPDNLLFGHLTPDWLLKELQILNNYQSIGKVKIIITHIKPEKNAREKIIEQIRNGNTFHFDFIFPQQGQPIWI